MVKKVASQNPADPTQSQNVELAGGTPGRPEQTGAPPFSRALEQPRERKFTQRLWGALTGPRTVRPLPPPPRISTNQSLRTLAGMKNQLMTDANPDLSDFSFPKSVVPRGDLHFPNWLQHVSHLENHYVKMINPQGRIGVTDPVQQYLSTMPDTFLRTQIQRRFGHGHNHLYHIVPCNKEISPYTFFEGMITTWEGLQHAVQRQIAVRQAALRARGAPPSTIAPPQDPALRYLVPLEAYCDDQIALNRALSVPHAVKAAARGKGDDWTQRTRPKGPQNVWPIGASHSESTSVAVTGGFDKGIGEALKLATTVKVGLVNTTLKNVDRDASFNLGTADSIVIAPTVAVSGPVGGAVTAELGCSFHGRYYESAQAQNSMGAYLFDEVTDRNDGAAADILRKASASVRQRWHAFSWLLGGGPRTSHAWQTVQRLSGKDLQERFLAVKDMQVRAAQMDTALQDMLAPHSVHFDPVVDGLSANVSEAYPTYSAQLLNAGPPIVRRPDYVPNKGNAKPWDRSVPSSATSRLDPSKPGHTILKFNGTLGANAQAGLNPEMFKRILDNEKKPVFKKPLFTPYAKLSGAISAFYNRTDLTRQQTTSAAHKNLYAEQMWSAFSGVVARLHRHADSAPRGSAATPFGHHPALKLANAGVPRGPDGESLIDWSTPLGDDQIPQAVQHLDLYADRTELNEALRRWLQGLDLFHAQDEGLRRRGVDPHQALRAVLHAYEAHAHDSHRFAVLMVQARETAGSDEEAAYLSELNQAVFDGAYDIDATSSAEDKRVFFLYVNAVQDLRYSALLGFFESTLASLIHLPNRFADEDLDNLADLVESINQQREAQETFNEYTDNGNHPNQQQRSNLLYPWTVSTNKGASVSANKSENFGLISMIRKKIPWMPDPGPFSAGNYSMSAQCAVTNQMKHPNHNRTGKSIECSVAMEGGFQFVATPVAFLIDFLLKSIFKNRMVAKLSAQEKASLAQEVGIHVRAMVAQEGMAPLLNSSAIRFIFRLERPPNVGDADPSYRLAFMTVTAEHTESVGATTPDVLTATPGSLTLNAEQINKTTQVLHHVRGTSLRANLVAWQSLSELLATKVTEDGREVLDVDEILRRLHAPENYDYAMAWFGGFQDPIIAALGDLYATSGLEPDEADGTPSGPFEGEYILYGHLKKDGPKDGRLPLHYRHPAYKNLAASSILNPTSPVSTYTRLRLALAQVYPEYLGPQAVGTEDDLWRYLADIQRTTRPMDVGERMRYYTQDPEGLRALEAFVKVMRIASDFSASVRLGAAQNYATKPHAASAKKLSKQIADRDEWSPVGTDAGDSDSDIADQALTGQIGAALTEIAFQRLGFIYKNAPGGSKKVLYDAGLGAHVDEVDEADEAQEQSAASISTRRQSSVGTLGSAASGRRASRAESSSMHSVPAPGTPVAMRQAARRFVELEHFGPKGREENFPPPDDGESIRRGSASSVLDLTAPTQTPAPGRSTKVRALPALIERPSEAVASELSEAGSRIACGVVPSKTSTVVVPLVVPALRAVTANSVPPRVVDGGIGGTPDATGMADVHAGGQWSSIPSVVEETIDFDMLLADSLVPSVAQQPSTIAGNGTLSTISSMLLLDVPSRDTPSKSTVPGGNDISEGGLATLPSTDPWARLGAGGFGHLDADDQSLDLLSAWLPQEDEAGFDGFNLPAKAGLSAPTSLPFPTAPTVTAFNTMLEPVTML